MRAFTTFVSLAVIAATAWAAPGVLHKIPAPATPLAQPWRDLEPGLSLGTFTLNESHGDSTATLHVLRIDPARFRLKLLNASAPGEGATRTAKEWCTKHDLVACINAAMYRDDMKTALGMMRTRGHVNNAHVNDDNAVLAFDGGAPAILDRSCDDFEEAAKAYGTLIQSIRMIGCDGENVWKPAPRRWSTAAIGSDAAGNILFFHARDPLPVHDLVDGIRGLRLDVKRLMYVEGGPEAQLWIHSATDSYEFIGSYETGFWESDSNHEAWRVPNVVGIERIPAPVATPSAAEASPTGNEP